MKTAFVLFLFFLCQSSFSSSDAPENAKNLSFSAPCDSKNQMITLAFVGDVLIHQALYESVVEKSNHFSQIWKRAEGLIQKADFSVANLEGTAALGIDYEGRDHGDIGFVFDEEVYTGTNFTFNYHPRILTDLKLSGFDLLTMANNHAMDRYSKGIDKTILAARDIGLPTVGTKLSNESESTFYKIATIKNIRVAFLGCTESINIQPKTNEQLLFCYDNPERILGIIKEVAQRPDVDALVVLPHWGVEYSRTPQSFQRSFARKYIEAGAALVIGSHPHVLQPWEKYTSSDGREALILYSLGNFVAGQSGLDKKTGTVAYIGLSKKGNQKAKIFGVGYTPTYRVDNQIIPIAKNGPVEISEYVSSMYGTKARLGQGESLQKVLCSQ
ncbi:MAG: CapA family protein [Bacteriovorax sp.]